MVSAINITSTQQTVGGLTTASRRQKQGKCTALNLKILMIVEALPSPSRILTHQTDHPKFWPVFSAIVLTHNVSAAMLPSAICPVCIVGGPI